MNVYRILDSVPNPWNWRFLATIVAASVVATATAVMRTTPGFSLGAAAILALSIFVVFAGKSFLPRQSGIASNVVLKLAVAPLLLGLPPIATAAVMGNPSAGGYPAVLTVLLGYVLFTTRDLEHRAVTDSEGREDFPVHTAYRGTLAWVSTVFFFFGTVSLWPWLGQIYDGIYFWILVIGVLLPTLFLWGRLRQPRAQNSLAALVRFNRALPYIGLILLIAILIG